MFKSYNELKNYVHENEVKIIDFKIITIAGKWRHLSIPYTRLSERIFTEGIGFDGSSYGYASIESSDMVFVPDMTTSFIDPYCETKTLSMIANIYEVKNETKRFEGDPRHVAEKAEKVMKELSIADQFVIGPEFEFYIFDHMSYEVKNNHQEVTIDSKQAAWNSNSKVDNLGYKVPVQQGYHAALPYDITNDLRSEMCLEMETMGIDVKYHHHEVGAAGQLEIEVELGDMLDMADKTLMTKYIIKNTAIKHGRTATFMPKPVFSLPSAPFIRT